MGTPLSIWNSRYAKKQDDALSLKYDYWMDRWKTHLEKSKKGIVLDIGCGIGLDTKYLTEKGHSVVSIDLSNEALSICKLILPHNSFIHVDIGEGLPFSEDSFQIIIANLSLHYFDWEKTKKIFSDVQRCLKTGGMFFSRLNSTIDSNFGSVGHEEIEPNLFLVNGMPKRFFNISDINKIFNSGWRSLAIEEIIINRFSKPKVVWEIIAEKV